MIMYNILVSKSPTLPFVAFRVTRRLPVVSLLLQSLLGRWRTSYELNAMEWYTIPEEKNNKSKPKSAPQVSSHKCKWHFMKTKRLQSKQNILIWPFNKIQSFVYDKNNYLFSSSSNRFWFSGRLINVCNCLFKASAVTSESHLYAFMCSGHLVAGLYMSKTHATISPTWIELVMALCGMKFFVEPCGKSYNMKMKSSQKKNRVATNLYNFNSFMGNLKSYFYWINFFCTIDYVW